MGIEVLYFTYKQDDWQQRLERDYQRSIWPGSVVQNCAKNICRSCGKTQIKVIYDTIDLHFVRMKRQWELGGSRDRDKKPSGKKCRCKKWNLPALRI
jgi:hypothetical protein